MDVPFVRAKQATQLATPIMPTSNAAKDNIKNLRASRPDLGILMAMLEVDVISLTECLVSRNRQLSFPAAETAGIHYNLEGIGQMRVGTGPPVPLTPHTLVITPPRQPLRIDAATGQGARTGVLEARWKSGDVSETVKRMSADSSEPEVSMICGYFRASYGSSIDLFATLASPIVERFDATDQLLALGQVAPWLLWVTKAISATLISRLCRRLRAQGLLGGGGLSLLLPLGILR